MPNIKRIKFKNSNIEKPILFIGNLPSNIVLIYTVIHLNSRSYKSQYNHLYSIKMIIEYYKSINIDFLDSFLNTDSKLVFSKLDNFLYWLVNTFNKNGSNYANAHIRNISMFFVWYKTFYKKNINNRNLNIRKYFSPYIEKQQRITSYYSLTENTIKLVLDLILPVATNNPFKPSIRVRNYAIVLLLIDTGIRLSELLKIKTNDFIRDIDGIYLSIYERNYDNEDNRIIKPKTKNIYSKRVIGVHSTTYRIIDSYILKSRKKNNNHSYLFTSERDGNPLSKSSVSNIFSIIQKKTNIPITPHVLRHNFAERMLKFLIEVKKIDMERAKDELRNICGWALNSNMPNLYTKNYISDIANKHNLERLKNEKNINS